MSKGKNYSGVEKSDSWRMFDNISSSYDLVNHVLASGLDIFWRRKLAFLLSDLPDQCVLDLATGTADVPLSLLKYNRNIKEVYGIDLSEKMLAAGAEKARKTGLNNRVFLQHGDAARVPFPDNNFNAVTMAFGIRNVEYPMQVLKEMFRVLKCRGRVLILEFSLPDNRALRGLHLFYLRNVVPAAGGLLSGNRKAYNYLNQTIEEFPYGDQFCDLMRKVGFNDVRAIPLMCGVATIYLGDKFT